MTLLAIPKFGTSQLLTINQISQFELNSIDYHIPIYQFIRETEFFKIKVHFCFQDIFKSLCKTTNKFWTANFLTVPVCHTNVNCFSNCNPTEIIPFLQWMPFIFNCASLISSMTVWFWSKESQHRLSKGLPHLNKDLIPEKLVDPLLTEWSLQKGKLHLPSINSCHCWIPKASNPQRALKVWLSACFCPQPPGGKHKIISN